MRRDDDFLSLSLSSLSSSSSDVTDISLIACARCVSARAPLSRSGAGLHRSCVCTVCVPARVFLPVTFLLRDIALDIVMLDETPLRPVTRERGGRGAGGCPVAVRAVAGRGVY